MAVAPAKIPPPFAVDPVPHAKSSGFVADPDGLPPLTSQTSWAAAGVTPSVRPAPSAIAEPAKKNLVFMVQSPIARAAGECGAVDDNGRPPRRFRVRARNGRLPEIDVAPKTQRESRFGFRVVPKPLCSKDSVCLYGSSFKPL